ncbi:MAG TPA: P-II family nitrogen regulator [Dehalococcoidia bacterium]|nr:P-II family nitrogen regulator [Dehalococcoidia bacterium]
MKFVIAFIKPFKVDEVKDALQTVGVTGMSITDIRGFGRQGGHTETYRGAEYEIDFIPKIRIEVLVDDAMAPAVVNAIEATARTDSIGDGKIAVLLVEDLVRIRTGERGRDAL